MFLSLLFLIHPINVESVAYIAATQSELFFLFGIAALLVSMKEKVSVKLLFLVSAFSLLSLLTKETGILFLLMIVCFQYLFNRKRTLTFFLFELATLGIYFFLRFALGGVFFAKTSLANAIPIDRLSLLERLVSVPAIVFYYLYTTIFPLQLAVAQKWIITKLTAQEFYLLMDNRNDRWWEIILAAEMGFIEEIDSTQWKKDAGMFDETLIWPPVPL